MSWVRRIARINRRCSNCWGPILPEEIYFLTSDGERYCVDCPPEEGEERP